MSRRGRAPVARAPSSSPSNNDDEQPQDFLDNLTRGQVLEIDAAFDDYAKGADERRAAKRRKLDKGKSKASTKGDVQEAGGFMLEDDEAADAMGGGFMPEEDDDDAPPAKHAASTTASSPKYVFGDSTTDDEGQERATAILLDNVPKALEALDLDGDDPSILSVFSNASRDDEDGNQIVKRKDFMKVIAVLVAGRDQDAEEERPQPAKKGKKVHSGGGKGRAVRMDVDEDEEHHDDSDPLVLSSDEDDEDDDPRAEEDSDPWADEDDLDGAFGSGRDPSPPSTRRKTRSVADTSKLASLPPSAPSSPGPASGTSKKAKGKGRTKDSSDRVARLSAKEIEECNRMFQQFFPSNDSKKNAAISMNEIRYVATLLNEKVSDADVVEMLEYASSTHDKRVNLEAFSKIMVDTRTL